jgi:hypothetical protein
VIRGRYGDTTGRPYFEGRLYLPRLKIVALISFLADTGADQTTVMPLDGNKAAIPYNALKNPHPAVGIGGQAQTFAENAILTFAHPGVALYSYEFKISIMEPSKDIMHVPSLLGRDIMNNWNLRIDPLRKTLVASVRRSDFITRLK